MKTKHIFLIAGMLLATLRTGLGQPYSINITIQPQNQVACVGSTATFTVGAEGSEPVAYQWQQSFDGINFSDRLGATNSILQITEVQGTDMGNYRVVITNLDCTVTSFLASLYTISSAPAISTSGQPTNWPSVSLGVNLTNRVIAGGALLSYQWRLNGGPLHGQTKSMIILTNLQLTDKGNYDVVVANACGSVTSRVVNLSVDPTFTKITAGPVVTDRANFVYGSWADYNGDGFSDLFVPAGADVLNQSPYLYQNLGGTNFLRMTASDVGMLVGSWPYCYQGLWADFNNDGLLDLLEIGGPASGISSANRLFLGNATHTFQRIQNVGENTPVWAWQCALLDYNNDGAVDVCYTTGWRDLNSKGSIYRNLGDGGFTHAWSATGPVFDNQYASCPDYDNDGYPDLWLTGGDGVNTTGQFYRNIQNGSFELVSDGSIPTSAI